MKCCASRMKVSCTTSPTFYFPESFVHKRRQLIIVFLVIIFKCNHDPNWKGSISIFKSILLFRGKEMYAFFFQISQKFLKTGNSEPIRSYISVPSLRAFCLRESWVVKYRKMSGLSNYIDQHNFLLAWNNASMDTESCHTDLEQAAAGQVFSRCCCLLFSLFVCVIFSWAFWEKAGGALQRAWSSEAGFTVQTAQRGLVPREAQTGGAQRPPEGRLQSAQVSHTAHWQLWPTS